MKVSRRREILKGAAAVAGTVAVGAPGLLLAQTQPIRIGITNALSGPNALFGENNVIGHKIVVNQYNKAGGMLGRQIELVVRDDRAQAAQGVANARELSGAGINLLMGGGSSAVAIGLCPVVQDLKMVYTLNAAGAMALTHEAWNRHVFRLCANAYASYMAIGRVLAEKHPNAMKWGAIVPDYSFGHDTAKTFAKAVKQFHPQRASKDFEIRPSIVVGATQTDFRPQINALMNSDLEGIFVGMLGAAGVSFFQQARAVGLDKKLKAMCEASGDVAFQALGKNMPDAVWSNVVWPYALEPTKSNKQSQQLLQDYVTMTGNKFPNGHVYKGFHALQGLLEGIKKAKSTETDAVISAMEGMTWESPIGPFTIRKEDHAVVGTTFVGAFIPDAGEPFFRLREAVQIDEASVMEPPSPGKEFVMG